MKVFKKLSLILLLTTLFISCSSSGVTQEGVEHKLVVLHTNDHHGHPLAFFDYPAPGQGGLAARSTYVKEIRESNKNVLVVDAGDFTTGRPESNFFQGEPDLIGYNHIGYDLISMGNHEFDYDWATVQKQIGMSNFPWLNANVKKDGEYLENVQPYIIKDYGDFKVAIIGLMTKETKKTGNPAHIGDLIFLDEVEVAKELVPKLKKKADIVIAVVHMGLYDTDSRGSRRLAAEVPGISLIVDGHSHTKIEEPVYVKGTPIVQARHWGLYMGNGELTFKDGSVTSFNWSLDPINTRYREKVDGESFYYFHGEELEEDRSLLDKLTPYGDKVDEVLSQVIGSATDVFLNDNTRKMETPLGNIVADSQVWFLKNMEIEVDFAFQNGGGIRATLGAGEIQKQTVYEVLPFDNSITLVSLKGSDVIKLFEQAAGNVGAGAMAQVSDGVEFVISGGSMESIKIGGEAVDPEKEYKIAVNSYLASGGDGYDIFKEAVDYYDSSLMQRDAFIDYVIHLGGEITPKTYSRITIK